MTLFWILSAALLLAATLFVALPLWRKAAANSDVLRDSANLDILRDQSAELETDLRNGLLTQDAYEQGKRELQARLLEEVKTTEQPVRPPRNPAKVLAIVLSVLLPIFSVSLYLTIGNPPQEPIVADADGIVRSVEALQRLEKRLKKMPNPDDWWTLARSYTVLKHYADATRAYEKLVELVPGEAELWANYADAYAMSHGQTLQGEEVARLLGKALELDANNMSALALSGAAARESGDYAAAITHWQKLVGQVQPGSQEAQMFNASIKELKKQLVAQPGGKAKLAQLSANNAPAKVAKNQIASISGKVSLSPALAGKVAPTDTVFILARAAEGPKMPLAVLRKQVQDLPLTFTLDDSMAMQPQLKLSNFDQVVVVARVTKSGTPMAQSGDLQGLSATIKPDAQGLNIVIDAVVP